MWPKILPHWVLSDPRRAAEVEVYNRLERMMPDEWTVFYSRPWWGIGPKGGELDGEADFIIAHPESGLLFLEVKGGAIFYDPAKDQWISRDRDGVRHRVKDPMKQAMSCKHRFLDRLKGLPGWPKFFVRFRHGVIFPHAKEPPEAEQVLGPYEKRLFCCSDEFTNAFDDWILERLAPHPARFDSTEHGPGPDGIVLLHDLVAKPASLLVPLVREIEGEIESMERILTGAQLALIPMIDSAPRVLVEGGAGTGKTVLATELAARCAARGQTVLFCCRSTPLAGRIADRMSRFSGVTVMAFEDLAEACRWRDGGAAAPPSGKPWDVAVIDEGQDFDWEWWDLIDQMIPREGGLLRVFTDSNQAVYRRRDDLETRLQAISFPLRVNLRNTKPIARATESLYEGPLIDAPGPDGTAPTKHVSDIDSAVNSGVEALVGLLRNEGIAPSMLALLVPSGEIRQEVLKELGKLNVRAADASQNSSECVTVETVARFKGLEAAIVLIVTDRLLANNQELSYVGVSRARTRLSVFGPISGTMLDAAIVPAQPDSLHP